MAIRANRKMPPSQRTAISPSPSAPPRHATPSNSETRKCYTQQVSPCLNGRHGSPQRLSNFGWRSVSYQEAPEMLIVLLGPPIAIFCRHDTRYFPFAFGPALLFRIGRYRAGCLRGQWGRRGRVYGCTVGFRRRAIASPQLGALDRSDEFTAHWCLRFHLNQRLVADLGRRSLRHHVC